MINKLSPASLEPIKESLPKFRSSLNLLLSCYLVNEEYPSEKDNNRKVAEFSYWINMLFDDLEKVEG